MYTLELTCATGADTILTDEEFAALSAEDTTEVERNISYADLP